MTWFFILVFIYIILELISRRWKTRRADQEVEVGVQKTRRADLGAEGGRLECQLDVTQHVAPLSVEDDSEGKDLTVSGCTKHDDSHRLSELDECRHSDSDLQRTIDDWEGKKASIVSSLEECNGIQEFEELIAGENLSSHVIGYANDENCYHDPEVNGNEASLDIQSGAEEHFSIEISYHYPQTRGNVVSLGHNTSLKQVYSLEVNMPAKLSKVLRPSINLQRKKMKDSGKSSQDTCCIIDDRTHISCVKNIQNDCERKMCLTRLNDLENFYDIRQQSVHVYPAVNGDPGGNASSENESSDDSDGESEDVEEVDILESAINRLNSSNTTNEWPSDRLATDSRSHEEELKYESARLKTFWSFPLDCPVNPTRLSQGGFYYEGNGDETVCFSCKVKHAHWRRGEDIDAVHARISPNCPLVTGQDSGNIPSHGQGIVQGHETVTGCLGVNAAQNDLSQSSSTSNFELSSSDRNVQQQRKNVESSQIPSNQQQQPSTATSAFPTYDNLTVDVKTGNDPSFTFPVGKSHRLPRAGYSPPIVTTSPQSPTTTSSQLPPNQQHHPTTARHMTEETQVQLQVTGTEDEPIGNAPLTAQSLLPQNGEPSPGDSRGETPTGQLGASSTEEGACGSAIQNQTSRVVQPCCNSQNESTGTSFASRHEGSTPPWPTGSDDPSLMPSTLNPNCLVRNHTPHSFQPSDISHTFDGILRQMQRKLQSVKIVYHIGSCNDNVGCQNCSKNTASWELRNCTHRLCDDCQEAVIRQQRTPKCPICKESIREFNMLD